MSPVVLLKFIVVLFIFLAGIGISGWLGFLGLVKGELPLSETAVLRGRSARIAGILCLCLSATLLGVCVWVMMGGLKH
jgi:hypothetical protein